MKEENKRLYIVETTSNARWEENQRQEYVPELRRRIMSHLDDLRHKINSNEAFPESEQDIDSLVEIDDHIECCLNKWYY